MFSSHFPANRFIRNEPGRLGGQDSASKLIEINFFGGDFYGEEINCLLLVARYAASFQTKRRTKTGSSSEKSEVSRFGLRMNKRSKLQITQFISHTVWTQALESIYLLLLLWLLSSSVISPSLLLANVVHV